MKLVVHFTLSFQRFGGLVLLDVLAWVHWLLRCEEVQEKLWWRVPGYSSTKECMQLESNWSSAQLLSTLPAETGLSTVSGEATFAMSDIFKAMNLSSHSFMRQDTTLQHKCWAPGRLVGIKVCLQPIHRAQPWENYDMCEVAEFLSFSMSFPYFDFQGQFVPSPQVSSGCPCRCKKESGVWTGDIYSYCPSFSISRHFQLLTTGGNGPAEFVMARYFAWHGRLWIRNPTIPKK